MSTHRKALDNQYGCKSCANCKYNHDRTADKLKELTSLIYILAITLFLIFVFI